jgi:hypothetical protein
MVKNKKLKQWIAENGFKVCPYHGEVSWITKVHLSANGTTQCFTRYLGDLEDSSDALAGELKVLNLSCKNVTGVL